MESIVMDLRQEESPLVLACSPRAGGNSDLAAGLMAAGLESAGAGPRLVHLRNMNILACLGCQVCAARSGHRCVLMERDQAEELFRLILASPMLFFASPIYFYHLPAAFKGFIDRAQRYYQARTAGDPVLASWPKRRAHTCLVAGRPRGEKLFEGSLLTMRYFLWPFNALLAEPLCLTGLDGPDDLRDNEKIQARVEEYAFTAWTSREK